MSITKLADRLVSAVVPTTAASASCGTFHLVYYRCCATRLRHKPRLVDDCGNAKWGVCTTTNECG